MVGSLELADFRRRVADNYAHARAGGPGPAAWMAWRMRRDEIFRGHPESPVPPAARRGFSGMAFFPYDPTWRLEATVVDAPGIGAGHEGAGLADAGARFQRLGDVVAQRGDHEIRLPLMWLDAYGGGLFLPFRDGTNGSETYGGGRYLLDQVKGADLGATPDGRARHPLDMPVGPTRRRHPRAGSGGRDAARHRRLRAISPARSRWPGPPPWHPCAPG